MSGNDELVYNEQIKHVRINKWMKKKEKKNEQTCLYYLIRI